MKQDHEAGQQRINQEICYAKSANAHHEKITVREHLEKVSQLAQVFGEEIGRPEAARLAGILHDFGKYGHPFQCVLDGTMQHVDHAYAGAVLLYFSKAKKNLQQYEPVLEAIQGHHDGLTCLDKDELLYAFKDEAWDRCPSGKTPSVRGEKAFSQAIRAFQADFPGFRFPKIEPRTVSASAPVADMLDTRMLLSCLVDADYSVSAADDDPLYLERSSMPPLDADRMLQNLENHLAQLRRNSTADSELNLLRNQVYQECGKAGTLPMGLFTLTAPTGVGKTLAMLHFALQHCRTHDLRRIIVALPFLTLAEQTEKEYREIFPEVLVDHSQSNLSEEMRELAARWDAPVIITTSVRLFESLFSNNPRDCRKLHNLAGSVILFDEAQSLPAELAGVTVQAVQALCQSCHCTMVFSTATQPDFGAIEHTEWNPTEILENHEELFRKMRRVHTQWRKELPLADVAEEMSVQRNSCCIVNLRSHARTLFKTLRERCDAADGLFLLTTDLCPGHRLIVVEEIKRRQKAGLPCLVVATQCIEAGVDLDFDVMYRALAPLESVIQAAGRCNRNGKLPQGGTVIVFEPREEGRLYPGDSYGRAAGIVKNLWSGCKEPELSDLQMIGQYYLQFFSDSPPKQKLQQALSRKDYPEVAKEYRLIKEGCLRLIVPWAGQRALFDSLRDAADRGCIHAAHLHAAAPITISCFDGEAVKACATPLRIRHGKTAAETGTYILNTGFESRYDPVMGFLPGDGIPEDYMP